MKNKKSLDEYKAHKYCSANRSKLLEKDQLCGCFYCESIFHSSDNVEYIDMADDEQMEGITALYPYCGIDSVIGEYTEYPITKAFMKKMHRIWFE